LSAYQAALYSFKCAKLAALAAMLDLAMSGMFACSVFKYHSSDTMLASLVSVLEEAVSKMFVWSVLRCHFAMLFSWLSVRMFSALLLFCGDDNNYPAKSTLAADVGNQSIKQEFCASAPGPCMAQQQSLSGKTYKGL
jgi:hypothetical protein